MTQVWIKKLLGIDALENRVNNLEDNKATLESKLLSSIKEKEQFAIATKRSLITSELEKSTIKYLSLLNINPNQETAEIILQEMNILEISKQYGFERYSPELTRGMESPVITISAFRENPLQYAHKLSKGIMNFPVGINLKGANDILNKYSGNSDIHPERFDFILNSFMGYRQDSLSSNLVKAINSVYLNKYQDSNWISLDPIDFLHNFDGIVQYVADSNITAYEKENAIRGLTFAKATYMSALEIAGTARIRDLSELLDYDQNEDFHLKTGDIQFYSEAEELKYKIKSSLLNEQLGTTYSDIESLLPLRSINKFRNLASKITSKILANDKEKKGLTNSIDKSLDEYSIGEAVLLSCYFARNVITQYKTLEDNIEDLFTGKDSAKVSGKCTDYTGLALHYLREYLIPMQQEKFKNWQFGIDIDSIANYGHSYMKITHVNEDLSVDAYFADPTILANSKICDLKNSKDIAKKIDGLKLPILITRDAEDLMYAANENMEHGLVD